MLKIGNIKAPRNRLFEVADYLWGGLAGIGISAVLIAFWQFGSLILGDFLLPSPILVFEKIIEILQNLRQNEIDITLLRAFFGVGGGMVLGVILGLLAGNFRSLLLFLSPLITILLTMPPIIWIVLALFWFGFGETSVVFTIFIIVLPLTFATSATAAKSLPNEHKELFDAYKMGIRKKIKYLYLPHIVKFLIPAFSVALSSGIKVVIMAELLGSTSGVGARIADARAMLDTTTVLAFTCIMIAVSALFEYLVNKPLAIIFMPWER